MESFFMAQKLADFQGKCFLRQMPDSALGRSFSGFCSRSEQSDKEINQGLAVLWEHLNEGETKAVTVVGFVTLPGCERRWEPNPVEMVNFSRRLMQPDVG